MNMSSQDNGHERLADALRRAAGDLARHEAPPALPAAVRSALERRRAVSAPERRRKPWRIASWAGGGLAAATLALALLLLVTAPGTPDEIAPADVSTAFLPVAASERWTQLLRDARDEGPAWVVPTELPRASLVAMGLPFDPARAAEPVRAELLVHASGDVLAVRFVK